MAIKKRALGPDREEGYTSHEIGVVLGVDSTIARAKLKAAGIKSIRHEGYRATEIEEWFKHLSQVGSGTGRYYKRSPDTKSEDVMESFEKYKNYKASILSICGITQEEAALLDRNEIGIIMFENFGLKACYILKNLGYSQNKIKEIKGTVEVEPGLSPASESISTKDVSSAFGYEWDELKHVLFPFGMRLNFDGVDRESFEYATLRLPLEKRLIDGVFRYLGYTEEQTLEVYSKHSTMKMRGKINFDFNRSYKESELPYLGNGLEKADVELIKNEMGNKSGIIGFMITKTLLYHKRIATLKSLGYTTGYSHKHLLDKEVVQAIKRQIYREREAYLMVKNW